MPRAFLITNKRYHSASEESSTTSRETSPERCVRTAEEPLPFDLRRTSAPDAVTSGHLSSSVFSDAAAAEALLALLPASPRSPANLTRGSPPLSFSGSSRDSSIFTPRPQDLSLPHSENRYEPLELVFRQPDLVSASSSAIAAVLQRVIAPKSFKGQEDTGHSQHHAHACPECGKRYSTSSNLARHRQTHRSVEDRRAARQCPHCDKVYVSMPAYSMHVRTHGQGCRCPYCGKCFSRPWLLQGHIRTHTGEKPFTCPICAKAFADKSNLRAHIQTHSSTKPFVCGRCGKAFALKSYLYKHEESSCMRLQTKGDDISPSRSMDIECQA